MLGLDLVKAMNETWRRLLNSASEDLRSCIYPVQSPVLDTEFEGDIDDYAVIDYSFPTFPYLHFCLAEGPITQKFLIMNTDIDRQDPFQDTWSAIRLKDIERVGKPEDNQGKLFLSIGPVMNILCSKIIELRNYIDADTEKIMTWEVIKEDRSKSILQIQDSKKKAKITFDPINVIVHIEKNKKDIIKISMPWQVALGKPGYFCLHFGFEWMILRFKHEELLKEEGKKKEKKENNSKKDKVIDINILLADEENEEVAALMSLWFKEEESGLAQALYDLNRDNVKLASDSKLIYIYDSNTCLWNLENSKSDTRLHELFKGLKALISKKMEDEKFARYVPNLRNLYRQLGITKYQKSILAQARGLWIKDAVDPHKFFDQDIDYLPLSRGRIINLKTLEIRKRTPLDRWTFEVDAKIKTEALVGMDKVDWKNAQEVEEFIFNNPHLKNVNKFFKNLAHGLKHDENVKNGELAYRQFLVQMNMIVGGWLSGSTAQRYIGIFYGPEGLNGKSALIKIIKKFNSKLFTVLNKKALFKTNDKNEGQHNTYMRGLLPPTRMSFYLETTTEGELQEETPKRVSGGDPWEYRAAYGKEKDVKEVVSQAKLIICTNKRIKFDATDSATLDRMHVYPFVTRFEDDPDPDDPHILKEDATLVEYMLSPEGLAEFFTYALLGCYRWYHLGAKALVRPPTLDYFFYEFVECSSRLVLDLIKDRCITGKDEMFAFEEFWKIYKEAAKTSKDVTTCSKQGLAATLKALNYKKVGRKTQNDDRPTLYSGFRILSDSEYEKKRVRSTVNFPFFLSDNNMEPASSKWND